MAVVAVLFELKFNLKSEKMVIRDNLVKNWIKFKMAVRRELGRGKLGRKKIILNESEEEFK